MKKPAAAILAAAPGFAILYMGNTLLTPLYPIYQRQFGFSHTVLTLIHSTYVLGHLTSLYFIGDISDRIGRRRTAVPIVCCAAAATLLFLAARSTGWLFPARFLSGLATALAWSTVTAWLAELFGNEGAASVTATAANAFGHAAGPLLAGFLAGFAVAPLHLTYGVYLVLVGLAGWLFSRAPETVAPSAHAGPLRHACRVRVPRELLRTFAPAAATGFAMYALEGYYTALVPGILRRDLGRPGHALAGEIAAEFFLAGAATIFATRRLHCRTGMLLSAAALLPSVGLFEAAARLRLLPLLVAGAAVAGGAAGLGARASLQVINRIAPPNHRAEIIAAYFVAAYLGNAIPVIGVGILEDASGDTTAHLAFAIGIAALGIALILFSPGESPSPPALRRAPAAPRK